MGAIGSFRRKLDGFSDTMEQRVFKEVVKARLIASNGLTSVKGTTALQGDTYKVRKIIYSCSPETQMVLKRYL